MKLLPTYLGLVIMTMASCKEEKSDIQMLLDEQAKAIASKIRTDTTVLQFRFGMTEENVMDRILELDRDSIIYMNKEKKYRYDLKTGHATMGNVTCLIAPEFTNGQLYKVTLFAEDDPLSVSNSKGIATLLMQSAIVGKYGSPAVTVTVGTAKQVYWFKNNMQIKVYENVNGAVLEYTDLQQENKMENEEQNKATGEKEKSQKDL